MKCKSINQIFLPNRIPTVTNKLSKIKSLPANGSSMLMKSLAALAVTGSMALVSCNNDYLDEDINAAKRTELNDTISKQKSYKVSDYLNMLGFSMTDSMENVRNIRMEDSDHNGSVTYAKTIGILPDRALFLCKDKNGDGTTVNYYTEFRVVDGKSYGDKPILEIYQHIPKVGTGCVILVPDKQEGVWQVYKRTYRSKNAMELQSNIHFGVVNISDSNKHKMEYTSDDGKKYRTMETVENNFNDKDFDWPWDVLVDVDGNMVIDDIAIYNIDLYNQ